MTSYLTCGLIAICGLLCAVAEPVAQQNYDGRNGPHVFGRPGEQVYIRGQNEGAYNVPGVGGTFQNAPSRGEHVYTDERGNTFVNHRNGAGPATHSINGPNLVASRGGQGGAVGPGPLGPPGRRNVYVGPNGGISATRPDGRTASIGGHRRRRRNDGAINRNRRDSFSVGRPDRGVDFSTGPGGSDFSVQRNRRDTFSVGRPDRGVDFSTGPGGSDFSAQRNRRDTFSVGRPDRGVDYSTGPGGSDFSVQRNRRSPQIGQVTRPDGRQVSYSPGSIFASGTDGRTVQQYDRRRRAISDARVTGENFAARDDRAGVWNDNGTSVWRRPDGRTVTTDRDGNVITSGSPNGRGPQHYSG